MKDQAKIDLADLTEAQRKMCVRLLAINNVEFVQNQDTYVATLKVPTSQVSQYLAKQVDPPKKQKPKPHNKQAKAEKENTFAGSDSKSRISKNVSAINKKQSNKQISSRKPLFKSVKLPPIAKLEQLYPEVEVYIYPKRLPLAYLQQQIEYIYENYWQLSRVGLVGSLQQCFLENVCPLGGAGNKGKNDQNLLNILETINHFQYKQLGVRIFSMFLSQQFTQEHLSYFLVLRALIEEFVGEKIINVKLKQKNTMESSSSWSCRPKEKIKWVPSQKQISQSICDKFLNVIVPDSSNIPDTFDKLTEFMYYCESRKSNFIKYYDLLDFFLRQFNRQSYDSSVCNLELSYSNNGSTINDIFVQADPRAPTQPISTQFNLQLKADHEQQYLYQQPEPVDNSATILQATRVRVQQICHRMEIKQEQQLEIVQIAQKCVESIRNMDKMQWIEAMGLAGNEEQIHYIEQTQMLYRSMCANDAKVVLENNLVKRILAGPGFIGLFSRLVDF